MKVAYLILLLPFEIITNLHVDRDKLAAVMFRSLYCLMLCLVEPAENGWNKDSSVRWCEYVLAEEVLDILLNRDSADDFKYYKIENDNNNEDIVDSMMMIPVNSLLDTNITLCL